MKEKISLIQMDVELGQVERNYEKAVQLMELALEDKPDILVLPETLNTGFFPSPDSALYAASDADGVQTKRYSAHLPRSMASISWRARSAFWKMDAFSIEAISLIARARSLPLMTRSTASARWEKRSRIPAALPLSTLRWTGSPARWRSAMTCAFVS